MDKPTNNDSTEQPAPQTQQAPQPQIIQQYVVQEKSLQGLGGALIFWMIVFALSAIGYIYTFAQALTGDSISSTASNVVALLFAPILTLGFIASTVLIAMQKKLAVLVTYIVLAVTAFYSVLSNIVSYTTNDYSSSSGVPLLIAGILIGLLLLGLVGLYFFVSKRVKLTLVK